MGHTEKKKPVAAAHWLKIKTGVLTDKSKDFIPKLKPRHGEFPRWIYSPDLVWINFFVIP